MDTLQEVYNYKGYKIVQTFGGFVIEIPEMTVAAVKYGTLKDAEEFIDYVEANKHKWI